MTSILKPCPHGKLEPGTCAHCAVADKGRSRRRNRRELARRKAQGKRTGSSTAYRKARAEVLARDGHRCTYVERGHRCTATTNLEAHHRNGNAQDDRKANLITLCSTHHRAVERAAARREAR